MRPGEQPYIVTVEVRDLHAISAEEASNFVRDAITAAHDARTDDHGLIRVYTVNSLPQNPTISDAIRRGEAGAL